MSSTFEASLALARVADLAGSGGLNEARQAVARQAVHQALPFIPRRRAARRMSERQVTAIMVRGYLGWFIRQMEAPSPLVTSSYLKRWYRAAIAHLLRDEGIELHQLRSWVAQR